MSDLSRVLELLKDDFEAADELVDEIYHRYFDTYFKKECELYNKFRSEDVSISDKDLEWILISLPLDIKMASGALAQFKQHNEIVKLKIKQRKGKNKDVDPEFGNLDEEFKLMSIVYSSVITRVELDISFSKELIMGAKKVWDARRNSDSTPIGEVVQKPDLPEYRIDNNEPRVDF